MSEIPEELYYAASHEWLRLGSDGTATVGITDYAQDQLGDVVFVELPDDGIQVNAGQEVSVVESVKTASDLYSPVSGDIVAVNTALEERPELINESPFQDGWIYKIRLSSESELDSLMNADDYQSEYD